jgi:hypothetical protein
MPRVLCELPNAADVISGVRFERGEHGKVSEDIDEQQAAAFCAIEGYTLLGGAADKAQAARQANRRKQAQGADSAAK